MGLEHTKGKVELHYVNEVLIPAGTHTCRPHPHFQLLHWVHMLYSVPVSDGNKSRRALAFLSQSPKGRARPTIFSATWLAHQEEQLKKKYSWLKRPRVLTWSDRPGFLSQPTSLRVLTTCRVVTGSMSEDVGHSPSIFSPLHASIKADVRESRMGTSHQGCYPPGHLWACLQVGSRRRRAQAEVGTLRRSCCRQFANSEGRT